MPCEVLCGLFPVIRELGSVTCLEDPKSNLYGCKREARQQDIHLGRDGFMEKQMHGKCKECQVALFGQ